MRAAKLLVFLLLAAFAAGLRARPFAWQEAGVAAHVQAGGAALRTRDVWKPEGAGDVLLKLVHDRAGDKGLSLFAVLLFALSALLALDAAAQVAGFGAAGVLAALLLPLALDTSAPGPWLFSAFFAMAFLAVIVRARRRTCPSYMLALLPVLAVIWPLFHSAGVLLAPFFALLAVADGLFLWWAAENAPQGGIFTAPPDPLLYQAEELDMGAFLRVLSWETKMNQFLHQRLGLTPAQLPSLTAGRAAEVLNSLLDIEDLPGEIGVPDPGVTNGSFRHRNRKMLDVQYRDALRTPPPAAVPLGTAVALKPLPLWAPLTAAAAAFVAVAVPPAGPQALGRLFAALSSGSSLFLSVPSGWWVSGPRASHPAAPYFWTSLVLFITVGLIGLFKNRSQFSAAFFAGGLLLFALVLPVPAAAPLTALAAILFSAAALRGLQREENWTRVLTSAAVVIVLLVALHFVDWDHMPWGASLGLGAVPSETAVK